MTAAGSFPFTSRRRALARRLAKIVAAPVYYMLESGQLRSMARARSVDRKGKPLPMLTYPALDYLHSIEPHLKTCDVIEFGCGQSTMWFAQRVRSLVGVEKNASFREALRAEFSSSPHITIVGNETPFQVSGDFDIVLLDGEPRVESGLFAPRIVRPKGIVIFDNSDVQSLSAVPRTLLAEGFSRVDFYGYSPTGVRKQCTSIFFKDPHFFRLRETVMPISRNSETEKLH